MPIRRGLLSLGSICPLTAANIAKVICLGLIAISFNLRQVAAAENIPRFYYPNRSLSAPAPQGRRANFELEHKSETVRQFADWVMDSCDNRRMPFVIVDKIDAKVYAFDANGRLRGSAPALLGKAPGDYAVPGIGSRKLSDIRPEERTTPAGRFMASQGLNSNGKDVIWVDYKNSISLHRVITNNPAERRLERLSSPTPLDHRISYGCINVPANFFDSVLKPTFTGKSCIVYVLPEIRPISEFFASYYDVDSGRRK
jgi:hypothetical protein